MSSESPETLRGLSEQERSEVAEQFFARFAWDGVELDPRTMTAERFLESL